MLKIRIRLNIKNKVVVFKMISAKKTKALGKAPIKIIRKTPR